MMSRLQSLENEMITESSFQISGTTLRFNNDEYPLSQIKRARVKSNTFKDHALRLVVFGLIVSSVVWFVTPNYFGNYAGPVSIFIGVVLAFATVRKYELQVEFEHTDETGLQWISIAKTSNKNVKALFESQVELLRKTGR